MRAGVRFLIIAVPVVPRINDRQASLKTPSVERLRGEELKASASPSVRGSVVVHIARPSNRLVHHGHRSTAAIAGVRATSDEPGIDGLSWGRDRAVLRPHASGQG